MSKRLSMIGQGDKNKHLAHNANNNKDNSTGPSYVGHTVKAIIRDCSELQSGDSEKPLNSLKTGVPFMEHRQTE